jgi:hypothetical protein
MKKRKMGGACGTNRKAKTAHRTEKGKQAGSKLKNIAYTGVLIMKRILKGIGCEEEDWINLVQDRHKQRIL